MVVATDTQVCDIIAQLTIGRPKLLPAPGKTEGEKAIAAIKRTIKGISVEGAIALLKAFNYHNDTFYYNKDKWVAQDLANDEYFPECAGRQADQTVVIWFWGGPPNKLGHYQGTLHTLLEDRILCEIEEKGAIEIAKLIGTDEAVECIK